MFDNFKVFINGKYTECNYYDESADVAYSVEFGETFITQTTIWFGMDSPSHTVNDTTSVQYF